MPIAREIGRRLPFRAAQELFGGNDFLNDYGQVAVDNMKAQQGGKNIFANMMAEAEKGEQLDDLDVKLEATALIVAGTDTTAISLTYLVWAVLSQSSLQKELEQEVAALPDGYRDADLERLPLLQAVIEESLRLYGAAPGMLPRAVPPGGVDLGGYYLPQATTATTQSYSLHRDPNSFPDPDEFIPARWLPSTSKDDKYRISEAAKAVFSPFGAGSRTCAGIHLAYIELRLATAEFFRRMSGVSLAPSATRECMEQENYFLIAPRGHKCEITMKR
ncbi:hypothetical protein LTR36_002423 [Oleoguttula mirabilis]|uniref:Cytochrome P450 n=1 Tax=Oleoguttula mirabilis TaxID=1507867 RepID=A0AAV9JKQ4_9PEZI|nr:hypothetical protein LTR36_002423 [Oleoguttula mirabilis]